MNRVAQACQKIGGYFALAVVCVACSANVTGVNNGQTDGQTVSQESRQSDGQSDSPSVEALSGNKETEKPVTFGVLSIDSAVSVNERFSPLLTYLSEKLLSLIHI